MRRFFEYWLPLVIWLGVIFVGSTDLMSAQHTSRIIVPFLRWLNPHISWAAINTIHILIRKLGHVTEYAILAVLLWRALRGCKSFKARIFMLFLLVWAGCVIFAASDEFHQSFLPSRTPSARDVMIDICGASIGVTICWIFATRRSIKLQGASAHAETLS
jgi:VanZ family protein